MRQPGLVVFDMAGTTVQVGDEVPAAFRAACAGAGLTLEDAQIRAVRGKSKRDAIAELLQRRADDPRVEQVHGEFRRILGERYQSGRVQALAGALDTFEWCRSRDIRIALNTGFDRALTDLLVRKLGWQALLDAVVCNDDVARGRPAPYLLFRAMERSGCDQVARVAAVGDTVSDLQAAASAGVGWGIGVLSGAHSHAELSAYPHHALIPGVGDLPALFACAATAQ